MTPQERYRQEIEAARNAIALECKAECIKLKAQIDAAHKRVEEIIFALEERDKMIGQLQERMDKMSEWAKSKGK
jgi:chromosome segregation ATPase